MVRLRHIAAALAGFVLIGSAVLGADADARADEQVPEDVAAIFAAEGVTDGIFRVHIWGEDFVSGRSSSDPAEALDEWIAPYANAAGEPRGLLRVWRPAGEAAPLLEPREGHTALVSALGRLEPTAVLVSDPQFDSWYALSDDTVVPLSEGRFSAVPGPVTVDAMMTIVSERAAESVAEHEAAAAAERGENVLAWTVPGAIALAILVLSAARAVIGRAHERRLRQPSGEPETELALR